MPLNFASRRIGGQTTLPQCKNGLDELIRLAQFKVSKFSQVWSCWKHFQETRFHSALLQGHSLENQQLRPTINGVSRNLPGQHMREIRILPTRINRQLLQVPTVP